MRGEGQVAPTVTLRRRQGAAQSPERASEALAQAKTPPITLSLTERSQLSSLRLTRNGKPSTHPWPPKEEWPRIRQILLERSQKSNPNLDPELTAYTPGETLGLLQHPTIQAWHKKVSQERVADQYDTIVFVPCAKTKPWVGDAIKKSKLYSAYNQLREEMDNVCFVTISEPLGIVQMQDWAEFPQYDNPGLFKDDAQRSGMTTKQWKQEVGECYGTPFDESAHTECIQQLGSVIAQFIQNNSDKKLISFVDEKDGPPSTHAQMLDVAQEKAAFNLERNPKRDKPRVSPLDYLRDTIRSA